MNDNFSLKWNKFQEHTSLTFKDLRTDIHYFDVTLACDDNKDISAHRVILSSCSPYFRKLFSRNKHSHPLVYMRGIETEDMERILDFMYKGEVDVAQDNLARFLEIADELKINGLDSSEHVRNMNVSNGLDEVENNYLPVKTEVKPFNQFSSTNKFAYQNTINNFYNKLTVQSLPLESQENKNSSEIELPGVSYDDCDESALIVDNSVEGYNNPVISEGDDPTAMIESVLLKLEMGKWQCKVCMKVLKSKNHAKEHAEIHIEGLAYPCDSCGKTCRTSGALRHHKKVHKRNQQKMPELKL